MFGLKKLFNRGATAAKRMENKDQFEAFCWGGIGIAFADGSCEQSEIDQLKKIIRQDENMSPFLNDMDTVINTIVDKFYDSPSRAKLQVNRELGDLKSDQEAKENVFATLYDLACMGDFEDSEKAVLKQYASALGVSTQGYEF